LDLEIFSLFINDKISEKQKVIIAILLFLVDDEAD